MQKITPDPHNKNYFALWVCGIVFVTYISLQLFLTIWYGLPYRQGLLDSLLSAIGIALAAYVIATSLHYYQPENQRYSKILVWVLILSGINTFANFKLIAWVLPQETEYLGFVRASMPLRYIVSFLLIGSTAIVKVLWNIQRIHSDQEKRRTDAEKLAREAELYNLRQQLQPHFLFNSLNSIIALIGTQPEQAKNMTFQLSDFLRGTLRKDDQQLITLQEEIDHLNLYLEIEKVRFGHRLDVQIITSGDSLVCKLPAMIIQPLLENAIKYGLYDTLGQVTITLETKVENFMLFLCLSNPFDTKSNSQIRKSSGFGLRSVQRRMFLLYGRTDLLTIKNDDNIFTATLFIPQLP